MTIELLGDRAMPNMRYAACCETCAHVHRDEVNYEEMIYTCLRDGPPPPHPTRHQNAAGYRRRRLALEAWENAHNTVPYAICDGYAPSKEVVGE